MEEMTLYDCTSLVALTLGRNLDEILPQEYSKSYRRLVLQDFTDDEGVTEYTVRNETTEQRKQFRALFDLLTRVNMTRDSMDDDEDLVTPVNFTAVGCILLEFTNALSSEMVRGFVEKVVYPCVHSTQVLLPFINRVGIP